VKQQPPGTQAPGDALRGVETAHDEAFAGETERRGETDETQADYRDAGFCCSCHRNFKKRSTPAST